MAMTDSIPSKEKCEHDIVGSFCYKCRETTFQLWKDAKERITELEARNRKLKETLAKAKKMAEDGGSWCGTSLIAKFLNEEASQSALGENHE